jgi:hypothetical protein
MVSKWGLQPGAQTDIEHFWRRWPSDWETANTRGGQKCLANFGHPSDNSIVMIDGARPVVYVYYYFN